MLKIRSGQTTLAFSDMNANSTASTALACRSIERAKSLAQEVTIEQIACSMLFSLHERNPRRRLTDAQSTSRRTTCATC